MHKLLCSENIPGSLTISDGQSPQESFILPSAKRNVAAVKPGIRGSRIGNDDEGASEALRAVGHYLFSVPGPTCASGQIAAHQEVYLVWLDPFPSDLLDCPVHLKHIGECDMSRA